jgi:hypothetical protein
MKHRILQKDWVDYINKQNKKISKFTLPKKDKTIPISVFIAEEIEFFREMILKNVLCAKKYIDDSENPIPHLMVISYHVSKLITKPVCFFSWNDCDFMFRFNFHDWKISIRTPNPIPQNTFDGIFDPNDDLYLSETMFEGFPKEFIFSKLGANDYVLTSQFSVSLSKDKQVIDFFTKIKDWYDSENKGE